MDTIHLFGVLDTFFTSHPDVQLDELLALNDAIRYYKRLGGKSLKDIDRIKTDRKLCVVASELEIVRYKQHSHQVLMQLVTEKFNRVFNNSNTQSIQNTMYRVDVSDDELIQAPLLLGPPVEICVTDDCEVSEYVQCNDIEFVEDCNGYDTVPVQSTVLDFLRPTLRSVYKNVYRNLKWYKGRYYQYTRRSGWFLIESLEEVTKDLFSVVCNNTRNMSPDLNKLYLYVERNDKFRMMLRRVLLKNLEATVKTHSVTTFHYSKKLPIATVSVTPTVVATPLIEAADVMVRSLIGDIVENVLDIKTGKWWSMKHKRKLFEHDKLSDESEIKQIFSKS